MPYRSKAQVRWAHTPAAKAAGFPTAEFDAATAGRFRALPEHSSKQEAIHRLLHGAKKRTHRGR